MMIIKFFVAVGLVQMALAIFLARKLSTTFKEEEIKRPLNILFVLISVFLFSYVAYLSYLNITNIQSISAFLVGTILCTGGFFVVLVLAIDYRLLKSITQSSAKIEESNKNLAKLTKELQDAKVQLESKNKELLSTMEDFYTLRLDLQKTSKLETIKRENQKIKDKISSLKQKG